MKRALIYAALIVAIAVILFILIAAANAACDVPGSLSEAVNQERIGRTICVPGYTKRIRPPTSYTNRMKKMLLKANDLPGSIRDYQLDHCIPLGLGGAPTSPNNLWMQRLKGKCNAHIKDKLELKLHREVCAGKITLIKARRKVMHWCER